MNSVPTLDSLNVTGKLVLLRGDVDVTIGTSGVENTKRLEVLQPTILALFEKNARKVVLLGHRGRPDGKVDHALSLSPLVDYFKQALGQDVSFVDYISPNSLTQLPQEVANCSNRFIILENMRFWSEEEANDEKFCSVFAGFGEAYVNDAFAVSHRAHASVVGIPQKVREKSPQAVALGIRFEEELKNLAKVTDNPQRPLISYISGIKKDKIDYIEALKKFSDVVLVGGRLPEYFQEDYKDRIVLLAKLNPDKEDITIHSIEKFEDFAKSARTIIVSGPIGKFEDSGHRLGTQRVFQAIAKSKAFKIAGGGDTEHAIAMLNLTSAFDWISIGGGAMLEYLAKGQLAGIDAVQELN